MASHYRDLIVWQKAMDLVTLIYRATQEFPPVERFGLTMQMRRAAISIPSNVAEGQGRGKGADFLRFLRVCNGSRQELETQTLLAQRLGFLDEPMTEQCLKAIAEVGRLLRGLGRSIVPN